MRTVLETSCVKSWRKMCVKILRTGFFLRRNDFSPNGNSHIKTPALWKHWTMTRNCCSLILFHYYARQLHKTWLSKKQPNFDNSMNTRPNQNMRTGQWPENICYFKIWYSKIKMPKVWNFLKSKYAAAWCKGIQLKQLVLNNFQNCRKSYTNFKILKS